ncbi:PD40 domain-containing protein [Fulvivirga sp. 29W222]|uniref:PD40 domain-containing protein n=1 Tax=Fulvivirga marina TaxID=2494733 RepID=A0A937FXU0_9BACT|nr:PD40 domain-containing protein [Fulvivirga marina]MBL6446742.1 PD40 domain-containing protein [Fulvivirga marina]
MDILKKCIDPVTGRGLRIVKTLLLINIISLSAVQAQENSESGFDFPLLEGPYMGQKPPGMVAEPFAPGIISKEGWELEGVFAPGMKEFYFTTSHEEPFSPTVIGLRQQGNVWKKYIEFKRKGETVFSPDGNRMHMAEGYKDRVGDGWSERKSLGPMFDREDWGIMRLSASAMGTYVFDDYKNGDVIRISKVVNGERQQPVEMGPMVNSGKYTAHPFIAPDESYLIWDSEREGGFGDSDLYISFRQEDGSWGPAINMGENVNSDKWDAYASVTPDGKYILFNRGIDQENDNVDIYWVDAQIIENLRPRQ